MPVSRRSKSRNRSARRTSRKASRSARRAVRRTSRKVSRSARRATRKASLSARRAVRRATRKVSRKASRSTRKSKSPKRTVRSAKRTARRVVKPVSEILESSYGLTGLADMMKENQKGYKVQRVAVKDPYKDSDKSNIDAFLAEIDESKPSPKKSAKKKSAKTKRSKKGPSPYNLFVKRMSPILKEKNPGKTQPEIMKLIGAEWKKQK